MNKFPGCKLVAIGSSTGGPRALEKVLTPLPAHFPVPIVITQHMPEGFTAAFAQRLNSLCSIQVKEAQEGDQLQKGVAYIAPGGYHMVISGNHQIALNQDSAVEYVRPSINVMLESAVQVYGSRIIGVILTGMGKDGADAMVRLKEAGGRTIVQDECTSVVFSMPKAVIEKGAADLVVPVGVVSDILLNALL
jgi:two-component system chemotaxis response regulator CheB